MVFLSTPLSLTRNFSTCFALLSSVCAHPHHPISAQTLYGTSHTPRQSVYVKSASLNSAFLSYYIQGSENVSTKCWPDAKLSWTRAKNHQRGWARGTVWTRPTGMLLTYNKFVHDKYLICFPCMLYIHVCDRSFYFWCVYVLHELLRVRHDCLLIFYKECCFLCCLNTSKD